MIKVLVAIVIIIAMIFFVPIRSVKYINGHTSSSFSPPIASDQLLVLVKILKCFQENETYNLFCDDIVPSVFQVFLLHKIVIAFILYICWSWNISSQNNLMYADTKLKLLTSCGFGACFCVVSLYPFFFF